MQPEFPSPSHLDPEIFDRFVAGESTPDERILAEQWLAERPDRQVVLQQLRQRSAGGYAVATNVAVDAGLDRLRQKLATQASRTATDARASRFRQPVTRRSRWRNGMAAVATVGLVAIAVPYIWKDIGSSRSTSAADARTYETRRAQRAQFELPDGSQVVLGPQTQLRYSEERGGVRTVTLQGQAYFTVVHAPERPFVVRSPRAVTQVLGTTFSVREYVTDREVQVAVAEGRVGFGTDTVNPVILHAGDLGRLLSGAKPAVTHDASIADVFGWTRGQLTFRDVPLHEAIPELERAYDITIQLRGTVLVTRRITATLVDESLDDMLGTIAPTIGAVVRREGRTVILSPVGGEVQ